MGIKIPKKSMYDLKTKGHTVAQEKNALDVSGLDSEEDVYYPDLGMTYGYDQGLHPVNKKVRKLVEQPPFNKTLNYEV